MADFKARVGKYTMSLEHCVVPESKKVHTHKKDGSMSVIRLQEPT